MREYHKINGIFKRDQKTNKFIIGEYALPEFEFLKDVRWQFTEKIDGTNIRIFWDGEKITFRGRTDKAQLPVHLFDKLNAIFQNDRMIGLFQENFSDTPACIYGEGYGNRIQKIGSSYIKDGVDFVAFDIRIGEWWLKREDVEKLCYKLFLDFVPIIGHGTLEEGIDLVKSGITSRWGDFLAEGIIAKPEVDILCRSAKRIITKIKYKDFVY
jgi:hypothetical protein